jgi:hypothetical protein
MWQTLQIVAFVLLGAVVGLSALSRRYPDVGWLQVFRINRPQLTAAQQAQMRRRAAVLSGFQLMLLGLAVPVVYIVSRLMMFNEPTALGLTIAGGSGLVLVVVGLVVIWRGGRTKDPRRDPGNANQSDREQEFYRTVTGRTWNPPAED